MIKKDTQTTGTQVGVLKRRACTSRDDLGTSSSCRGEGDSLTHESHMASTAAAEDDQHDGDVDAEPRALPALIDEVAANACSSER